MPARATPPAQPPPPPPSALADPQLPSDLLLYRLAKLAASSGRLVTRLLERRYGITRREWGVLMWLAREPGVSPASAPVRPRGPLGRAAAGDPAQRIGARWQHRRAGTPPLRRWKLTPL